MRGEAVLRAIQDVEWVVGSFVGDADGQLLLYQMPDEFSEEQLIRTTARLANIVQCAEFCELQVEQCNLSLSRYQLVLRRFSGGVLCVMVDAPVSKRALNMAIRIALEHLPDVVEDLREEALALRSGGSSRHVNSENSRGREATRGSEPPYEDTTVSVPPDAGLEGEEMSETDIEQLSSTPPQLQVAESSRLVRNSPSQQ